MIENGYTQILVNYNKDEQFTDALIVARNKVKFVNELDNGTFIYSTETLFQVNSGNISVIERTEKGGAPWESDPLEFDTDTTTYSIDTSGLFVNN